MSGNAGEALRAMIYVHRRALWQHAAQGFCRLVAAEELDPVCGHDFSNEINALFDDLGQLVPSSEEFHRSLGYYRTVLATHTGWKEPHDLEDCGPAAQFWAQLDEYADMVPAPWLVPRIALPLLASQIDTWTPQELERIFHVLDWSTWVKPVCADDMLRATVNSRQATLARLQQLNSRNGFAWYWLGRLKAANGSEQESRAARAAFKRAHQLARTNTYYYSTALDARGANYRAGTVVDGE